jgi:hypothetical protein
MSKSMFVVVCLFVSAACGGDDEPSPVEKCYTFVDRLCGRGVECFGGSQDECVQAVQSDVSCGNTREVTSTYNRCMQQVINSECNVLFPVDANGQVTLQLPADCIGVFQQ